MVKLIIFYCVSVILERLEAPYRKENRNEKSYMPLLTHALTLKLQTQFDFNPHKDISSI